MIREAGARKRASFIPLADQQDPIAALLNETDPMQMLHSGKLMARAWAHALPEEEQLAMARSFLHEAISVFWETLDQRQGLRRPALNPAVTLASLDGAVTAVAGAVGRAAARLELIPASYELGNIYTALLPSDMRSGHGIFYTPPALTERLLSLSELAGVNWQAARVIDPACGGGAFLMPVALRMVAALGQKDPSAVITHINEHLRGYELDAFGAWLTQVFVAAALRQQLMRSTVRLASLIHVCNSLETAELPELERFDLVIGNPPYGKVKSTEFIRDRFGESLYGHPNYYSLFTHLATDLVRNGGVISYLTPTSFLSGEYFKNLRKLLRNRIAPVEMDFVTVRKGVFEDVLQETMLSVYQCRPGTKKDKVRVNQITTTPNGGLECIKAGVHALPNEPGAPWIIPRVPAQEALVKTMKGMKDTLTTWGYRVSTGQLVWNRHKEQLVSKANPDTYPIIWAEAVTADGRFEFKSEKKNHVPFFRFQPGQEFLIVRKPCILLQRTTSKEQDKRLIAAALPGEFWEKGVVVENHLNMILPTMAQPLVPAEVLATFLNSRAVNESFRTISGSVAVSAYELDSLPLPSPAQLKELTHLIISGATPEEIERACVHLYYFSK